jgi:hypothetical protein
MARRFKCQMEPNSSLLRSFVSRWTKRSDSSLGEDIDSVFDRFIYTYIAFNSLYTAAAYVHSGKIESIQDHDFSSGNVRNPASIDKKIYGSEQFRASEMVYILCEGELTSFCSDHRTEILELCSCIRPKGPLCIHEDGSLKGSKAISGYAQDAESIKKIEHDNDIKALLSMIYRIRCNLMHGAKSHEESESQIILLSNSTKIIRNIIEVLLSKVEEKLEKLIAVS